MATQYGKKKKLKKKKKGMLRIFWQILGWLYDLELVGMIFFAAPVLLHTYMLYY